MMRSISSGESPVARAVCRSVLRPSGSDRKSSTSPSASRPLSLASRICSSVYPRSRRRATIRTWVAPAAVQRPLFWGISPSLTQRLTVACETPARAATCASVSSRASDVSMAGSLESSPMAPRAPIHLRPTNALAERVLLPGDPGRALALAQLLLERPLMFNHHRGLWGYTGVATDGESLTIQSTGMGGPSAAIVLEELIALGVRRAIRVGTCGALDGDLELGDLLIAREALAADGASRSLGAGERIAADRDLTAALEQSFSGAGATVASTDLFYEPDRERERSWRAAGAIAVEMEAATLFAIGARLGVPVACVLTVSDVIAEDQPAPTTPQRAHIDDEDLLTAAEAMGRLAVSALAV